MSNEQNLNELFENSIQKETTQTMSAQFERWNWDTNPLLVGYFLGTKTIVPKNGGETFTVLAFLTLDGKTVECSGSKDLMRNLVTDDELGYRIYKIVFKGMIKLKTGATMRIFNIQYAQAENPINPILFL